MLLDPNIIWIGYELIFRAGGLAAGPDRGRRPMCLRIVRTEVLRVHRENLLINFRKKLNRRTQGCVGFAPIEFLLHGYRLIKL